VCQAMALVGEFIEANQLDAHALQDEVAGTRMQANTSKVDQSIRSDERLEDPAVERFRSHA